MRPVLQPRIADRRVDGDVLHGDLVAEPRVQRLRHDHLRARLQLRGHRREQQPAQAGAEGRQADALARVGQQDLADHLVDMILIGGLRRLARTRRRCGTERRSRVRITAPLDRSPGVARLISTVPCGACVGGEAQADAGLVQHQSRRRASRASRSRPSCTLTQGSARRQTLKGQPAMMKVSDPRRIGAPALARVLPGVAVTVPPCGHIMRAGGGQERGHQVTSSAPLLTETPEAPTAIVARAGRDGDAEPSNTRLSLRGVLRASRCWRCCRRRGCRRW